MSILVSLIAFLAVAGIIWWLVASIPLPQPLRIVALAALALVACVFILRVAGAWGGSPLWR